MKLTLTLRHISTSALLCALLWGCNGEQRQQDRTVDPQAAAGDQAAWIQFTRAANQALSRGDKVEAEKNFKQAIVEAQRLGKDTPTVASAVSNLADFYYAQGAGEQANDLYTRSLTIKQATAGLGSKDLAQDLIGLGKVNLMMKQYKKSASYFDRASKLLKGYGEDLPEDVRAQFTQAKTLSEKN